MINSNITAFYTVMKFAGVRGLIFAGLLVFYFIRICDQSVKQQAVIRHFQRIESSGVQFIPPVAKNPVKAHNEQVVFSRNNKNDGRQGMAYSLKANEVSHIKAKSKVQQSR